jgi:hypothetical protein
MAQAFKKSAGRLMSGCGRKMPPKLLPSMSLMIETFSTHSHANNSITVEKLRSNHKATMVENDISSKSMTISVLKVEQ